MKTLEDIVDACVRLYLAMEPEGRGAFTVKPVRVWGETVRLEWAAFIGDYIGDGKNVEAAARALHDALIKSARRRIADLKEFVEQVDALEIKQ